MSTDVRRGAPNPPAPPPPLLQQQRRAVVRQRQRDALVEQYCDFAAELAEQYIVMERGEIIQRDRGKDMGGDGVRQHMSI